MKNHLRILTGAGVVVALLAIAYFGYRFVEFLGQPESSEEEDRPIEVIVETVAGGAISEIRTYNGNIEPFYVVDLMPQIQGHLISLSVERNGEKIPVTENLKVKEGEILATLDYGGLLAEMNKAKADYRMADRTEKEKLREKKRWEQLYEEGKGPATEQQRDAAVWEYDVAVEDTKSKKGKFDSMEWEYKQAFLKAPFDGVVSMVYVDKGATVGPGTPVLRLVHLDRLKVIAYVPNRYIGEDGIRAGETKAEIRIERRRESIRADVSKIYEEADLVTRTTPVEIHLANEKIDGGGYLIRGNMYARVDFYVRTRTDAVRIPTGAIVRIDKDYFVFVVRENKAVKTQVGIDIWEGRYVEIVSGLQKGDTIVVGGQTKLKDGSAVKIIGEGARVEPVYPE